MLVTSCILIIVIQTKCVTMSSDYPEYFDHAATQDFGPNDKTMEEFPLPNLSAWSTLFPTPTPTLNATRTKRTRTTSKFVTKFFYIANANMSDIFTVTKSTLPSTTVSPYLTGFVTTPRSNLTFPPFILMSTATPTTDIIIPAIYETMEPTTYPSLPIYYFTTKKTSTLASSKKGLRITLPKKVLPITLPKNLSTITLPKNLSTITLPKKLFAITLHTKVPPTTFPKKVPAFELPIKVDIVPSTLPKKLDRSGLNSSTSTSTTKQPLGVSPTVPTRTDQTAKRNATNKTNATSPSVKVSTTVKLKAKATSHKKKTTTVKPTSDDPSPISGPKFNASEYLPSLNEAGMPTVIQNETNVQISNTTSTSTTSTTKQEGPTTTVLYEDVIEYEELTTEPFSKFLERLLHQLVIMDKTHATRFIRNFNRMATSKANAGAFHDFGPVTVRYIEDMLPGLETSTDILQRMFTLAYSNLKSRRKFLAVDTNELLDYMDIVFEPSEERLMQEILNNIMRYPNTSKSSADICADIINDVIIKPSKRLSGTKKGNVLFKSLDTIIVTRHPEYDHHRKNLENKGKVIAAIINPVGNSNRGNIDSFHYSNRRKLKALDHASESNRRYDGSIENAKGKKNKAMHYLNKGNIRKWIHDNEGYRKQYDRFNNALRREIEPTNHGTESNRRNYRSIHNDKSREIDDINHVNEDKRKYDSVNYSKGRKSKAMRNFNEATSKKNGSINIAKNKGNKAINHFNKTNRKKYKMTRKKLHDRRLGKENLRRSYNTLSGPFQPTGWISNEIEGDKNKYNGETDNVFSSFSDSDEFVQSESDDENDEIEMERHRKANIVFDRIQKLKSKHVIEPVMKTKMVRRPFRKKIKWGVPSWNPNENKFAVLRQGHNPSQRRTDREINLLNNRGLLLKKGFPNNKINNNILRIGPQHDNVNFSHEIKSQFQNNIRPVKKTFESRQLNMLQMTKLFHNYKSDMAEIDEPGPWPLMDKTLINRTSNTFTTERYTAITPYTYFNDTPQETLNNNSNNERNSYNQMNKKIGRLIPSNARTDQQVMSVDYDNSPNIIDFRMKVKLKKPQDARDGGKLVFVNDHYMNKVNMRGREAQDTEETRTWDPYQMDKYFGKTKVTRRAIKKREYLRKPVSDTSDNSDNDMSQYERDVDDEESEQDESDRYTFKEVNRKNIHSKHHHKNRVKRHKRKNHDRFKHKKQRRNVRLRHGTHKKNRKKHSLRSITKKRKHGRNKHSHHKNHRYYKNKRGKKPHLRKHAMAIDPIRNRASDTRPIPVGKLFKYENEESSISEENSSNSTEQTVGISAPENKRYKPIGNLMGFDKASTLKSNNEVETNKQPSKVNSPERAESEAQPKNSQDLENKAKEDKKNEGKVKRRNPKRRGGYVTIGLLMDDMIYRFRENELRRNVYDAFRQNYRRNYRRTMGMEFHSPVLPPLVIREDSVYTDEEAVLKRNIYKAIKNQNADMFDQNKPKVLKRNF